MPLHDNIRKFREQKQWSQEYMAEQLGLSKNGYAKIERGESRPSLDRLEQITAVFGIGMTDLFSDERQSICLISENSQHSSNYYHSDNALILENEKLKLALTHKDELLTQKDEQITLLKNMVAVLQSS
ncbi:MULTISPECIES: helix-turn-helix domain-containing protein [Moraxella]|nr:MULTISPECIES: helix-turn-helix transcriptional regulator [Moraxella]MBE9579611.1 helix-turn-helix transcriptional regulator [Moraxella sp. K1664]MBE9589303.1 helix-turn-helix transcriptional regulator [Moraxella sp. K1630]MBE9591013.1 helix-turn-helix transcriptional regulator [Moraxella sp. K127]MBE9597566.1 helix-turn-helix transcriptional regulator [Moraxella sp. K2450]MDH9219720.1 helix-turn-helix transcriptional regulator [Moraxella lacunata]